MNIRCLLLLTLACWLGACTPNNVKDAAEWEKHFTEHKLEGTFMIFDNGQGTFRVYNIERAKQRFMPGATFHVFQALTGLHTGAVSDTGMLLDSVSLAQAFRHSNENYFAQASARIGRDTMQRWLDSLHYGNAKFSRIDTFWRDNSLQISPDEQLGLMKQLYFNQLPFQKRAQELVFSLMQKEETPKYKLSYITGEGKAGARRIAWIAGWVEENRHPSFFVLNFDTEDAALDLDKVRNEIMRGILKEEGFFEGKK